MRSSSARFAAHLAAALALVALADTPARAQSTTFTYQGSLDDGGAPAGGLHDFRFRLFSVASGGVPIGSTLCVDNVSVVEGVFTVQLDFEEQFATTAERYLEVEVRVDAGLDCGDATGLVALSPRQQLTATPMASHANAAFALDAADGSPTSAVFVDDVGKVGIGTTSPAVQIHLRSSGPVMVLQDTESASNQAGYLGFWNNVAAETGWVGFGSPGSPHFSVLNARSGGGIKLWAGGAERLSIISSGSVGVGTSSPGAKLDVRGDIRLGSSGQLHAASGEEKLRFIRGRILSNGAVSLGTGFTASRTSTGVYVISFDTAFASTPVVTVSASVGATGGPFIAMTNGVTILAAGVRITTGSGTNVDDTFEFIATGPR